MSSSLDCKRRPSSDRCTSIISTPPTRWSPSATRLRRFFDSGCEVVNLSFALHFVCLLYVTYHIRIQKTMYDEAQPRTVSAIMYKAGQRRTQFQCSNRGPG